MQQQLHKTENSTKNHSSNDKPDSSLASKRDRHLFPPPFSLTAKSEEKNGEEGQSLGTQYETNAALPPPPLQLKTNQASAAAPSQSSLQIPAKSSWHKRNSISPYILQFKSSSKVVQKEGDKDEKPIDELLKNPPVASFSVNVLQGIMLSVPPSLEWVAGLDKTLQATAILLKAVLKENYKVSLVKEALAHFRSQMPGFYISPSIQGNAKQNEKIDNITVYPPVAQHLINFLEAKQIKSALTDAQKDIITKSVDLDKAWADLQHINDGTLPQWYNKRLFKAEMTGHKQELERYQKATNAENVKEDAGQKELLASTQGILKAILPNALTLEKVRTDPNLTDHSLYRGLWNLPAIKPDEKPQKLPIVGQNTSINNLSAFLFFQQCNTGPDIAKEARKDGKKGHAARKRLMDNAVRLAGRIDRLKEVSGDTKFTDHPSKVNAPAVPSELRSAPALVPPFFDKAAKATHRFTMSLRYPDTLEAISAHMNNRYYWEVIHVPENKMENLVSTAEDMEKKGSTPGWSNVLAQRIDRQVNYLQADLKKAKAIEGLSYMLGSPGIGMRDLILASKGVSMIGEVIKTFIEMVTQPSNEKSIPLDTPGLYVIRCSVTTKPPGDAQFFRAPAVAWLPVWVRSTQKMAEMRLELTNKQEEASRQRLQNIEKQLQDPKLSAEDRKKLEKEKADLELSLNGSLDQILKQEQSTLRARVKQLKAQNSQTSSNQLSHTISQLEKRISEIDTILAMRKSRIEDNTPDGIGLESAFRLPAVFVSDDGMTINLALEAIQQSGSSGKYVYYVSDSTTKNSAEATSDKKSSREDAIVNAITKMLEAPDRYGRGYCRVKIPPLKGLLGKGVNRTVRIDADLAAIAMEGINNITTVIQIAAVAAAPFTGGASLSIMLPVGLIGSIPSAYRLVDRASIGTLRLDWGSAIDMVDILGSFLTIGKAAKGLKGIPVGKGMMMLGLGADGLGFALAGAQFVDQISNIDPNLSPGAKRAMIMQLVGQQLMSLGIQLGASLFAKGKQQFDENQTNQVQPHLDRADADLHQTLKQHSGHEAPIFKDPSLNGNDVHVHYRIDGYGLVKDVHLKIGPTASAADIKAHAKTVKTMQKFTGVQGFLRNILDRIATLVTGNPQFKRGTAAWEAKLELEKLPRVIRETMRRVQRGEVDPADADAFIKNLEKQIDKYKTALDDFSPGKGHIAADAHRGAELEAISQGYPAAPNGHYYIKTESGDFKLRRHLGSDAIPQKVVKEGDNWKLKTVPHKRHQRAASGSDMASLIEQVKKAHPDHTVLDLGDDMVRVNGQVTIHKDALKAHHEKGTLGQLLNATKNPSQPEAKSFLKSQRLQTRTETNANWNYLITFLLAPLGKVSRRGAGLTWHSAQVRSLFAAMSDGDRRSLQFLKKADYHRYQSDLPKKATEYALSRDPQSVGEFVQFYQFYGETLKTRVLAKEKAYKNRVESLKTQAQLEGKGFKIANLEKQAAREVLGVDQYSKKALRATEAKKLASSEGTAELNKDYTKKQSELGGRSGLKTIDASSTDGEMVARIQGNLPYFANESAAIYHAVKHIKELPSAERTAGKNTMDSYYQSAWKTIQNPTSTPTVSITASGAKSATFYREVGSSKMMAIVIITPENKILLATYMGLKK